MNAKNHRLYPIGPIVRNCGKKQLFVRLEFDQIGVQSEKNWIFIWALNVISFILKIISMRHRNISNYSSAWMSSSCSIYKTDSNRSDVGYHSQHFFRWVESYSFPYHFSLKIFSIFFPSLELSKNTNDVFCSILPYHHYSNFSGEAGHFLAWATPDYMIHHIKFVIVWCSMLNGVLIAISSNSRIALPDNYVLCFLCFMPGLNSLLFQYAIAFFAHCIYFLLHYFYQ